LERNDAPILEVPPDTSRFWHAYLPASAPARLSAVQYCVTDRPEATCTCGHYRLAWPRAQAAES